MTDKDTSNVIIAYGSTLGMILPTLLGRYGVAEVCDRLATLCFEEANRKEEKEAEISKKWRQLENHFTEATYAAMELEETAEEYQFFDV